VFNAVQLWVCIMLVIHSQKSCTRNLYKSTCTKKLAQVSCFLVQVFSCTSIVHPTEHNSIQCKKLADTWPKLRDVIGWLLTICCFVTSNKTANRQQSTKFAVAFLSFNSALFVNMDWLMEKIEKLIIYFQDRLFLFDILSADYHNRLKWQGSHGWTDGAFGNN